MKILDFFNRKKPKTVTKYRSFASAKISNLFSGWNGTDASINQELINNLQVMRNRVRQVCNDNEYARKFLFLMKQNVVHNGFRFQAVTKRDDGAPDKVDNNTLERAFRIWGDNKNFCSASHQLNWVDTQRLVIETLARDGEVFIRKIRGLDGNPFGFSLQVMEGDYFSLQYNKVLDNGNVVIMGIEQNQYGQPIAYHKSINPTNNFYFFEQSYVTERIPAEEIIHLYIHERPNQARGIPWLNTALRPLEMLYQYQESELVASRIGASAMGFYTSPDSQGYTGSDEDSSGNLVTEFQAGTFQQLPDGVKFESFNPDHPTTAYPNFIKSVLRGISSGLGISYASLASDLTDVNYSSIRAGLQDERGHYEILQNFMIENFCRPIYKDWLRMAITTGWLELPMAKITKFEEVIFIARGWDYVDPLKEIKAHQLATQMGIESLTEIASSKGKDLEEILLSLKKEKDLAEALDLKLEPPISEDVQQIQVIKDEA